MKKEKHHYNFFVHIHTMCIKSDIALLTEKEINQKRYMKRFSFAGGKAIYIINPNKYENGIMDVAGLKRVVGEITHDLVLTEYDIDRVDIAIDTNIPYEKLYKINSYLKELYAEHINQANSYYTNGADLTKR
ncbi:MAG: hypothetical protein LIO87_11440, partial [Eubacterium sp.]|nr:hypothetical protein [Eubacterium sp.]